VTSYFIDDTKDPRQILMTKMCFLILSRLLDSKIISTTLYDPNFLSLSVIYQYVIFIDFFFLF